MSAVLRRETSHPSRELHRLNSGVEMGRGQIGLPKRHLDGRPRREPRYETGGGRLSSLDARSLSRGEEVIPGTDGVEASGPDVGAIDGA